MLVLALGELLQGSVGGHCAPPAKLSDGSSENSGAGGIAPTGGGGRIMSESDKPSSARRIARLMFCQLLRTGQEDSSMQMPVASMPHSVSATGPSMATRTWPTEISDAFRARLYPPFAPR